MLADKKPLAGDAKVAVDLEGRWVFLFYTNARKQSVRRDGSRAGGAYKLGPGF